MINAGAEGSEYEHTEKQDSSSDERQNSTLFKSSTHECGPEEIFKVKIVWCVYAV